MNAVNEPMSEAESPRSDHHRIANECWQVLLQSVRAGRPMTLPNFIRLYRRQMAIFLVGATEAVRSEAADVTLLRNVYRRYQPFRPHSPAVRL